MHACLHAHCHSELERQRDQTCHCTLVIEQHAGGVLMQGASMGATRCADGILSLRNTQRVLALAVARSPRASFMHATCYSMVYLDNLCSNLDLAMPPLDMH
eukprot:TRINITY_DN10169_c0_g1_i5.p4 TRINITY_DN10169_c0_g1~~TRINITY_DN10169_c0_g1_i5.p4  ORF type:complete len:101 (+),score=8.54 TRINITY_DN10169_c0_g1_i5:808-1110(+)